MYKGPVLGAMREVSCMKIGRRQGFACWWPDFDASLARPSAHWFGIILLPKFMTEQQHAQTGTGDGHGAGGQQRGTMIRPALRYTPRRHAGRLSAVHMSNGILITLASTFHHGRKVERRSSNCRLDLEQAPPAWYKFRIWTYVDSARTTAGERSFGTP